MSEWHAFAGRDSLDQALAAEVATRLERGVAAHGTAYLVVSGGSTPARFFSLLARAYLEWSRILVLLADERCVAPQHDDSNERLVRETLLTGPAAQAEFLSLIPAPDDEIASVAGLSTLLAALPRFDVVILGMGEDAHTASLFPCSPELRDGLTTQEGALITNPKTAPHRRVSLSRHRLQNTQCGIIHIVGDKKRAMFELRLARSLAGDSSAARRSDDETRYPINAFLGPIGFDCWWAP